MINQIRNPCTKTELAVLANKPKRAVERAIYQLNIKPINHRNRKPSKPSFYSASDGARIVNYLIRLSKAAERHEGMSIDDLIQVTGSERRTISKAISDLNITHAFERKAPNGRGRPAKCYSPIDSERIVRKLKGIDAMNSLEIVTISDIAGHCGINKERVTKILEELGISHLSPFHTIPGDGIAIFRGDAQTAVERFLIEEELKKQAAAKEAVAKRELAIEAEANEAKRRDAENGASSNGELLKEIIDLQKEQLEMLKSVAESIKSLADSFK